MKLNDVLLALLEPVGATGKAHLVSWDTVQWWPTDALDRMLEAGILAATASAKSIECTGCENRCYMEVRHPPAKNQRHARAVVVCDDPEMQKQMGLIKIPPERLQQWRVTPLQLAKVVARLLAIESNAKDRHGQDNIRIGMVKGKGGRRWLSMNKSPLTLEINAHHLPLEEVLFFENDTLSIDRDHISQLLRKAPSNAGKRYTPSIEKREAGKRKTELRHEDWQEAYRELRSQHPDTTRYPDTWIASKIAKMEIAKGRTSSTILRVMKG